MHGDTASLASVFFTDIMEDNEPVHDDILSAMRLAFDNNHIEFTLKMPLSQRAKVLSDTARLLLDLRKPFWFSYSGKLFSQT